MARFFSSDAVLFAAAISVVLGLLSEQPAKADNIVPTVCVERINVMADKGRAFTVDVNAQSAKVVAFTAELKRGDTSHANERSTEIIAFRDRVVAQKDYVEGEVAFFKAVCPLAYLIGAKTLMNNVSMLDKLLAAIDASGDIH